MKRKIPYLLLLLAAVLLSTGCAMRTVDQMYCLPKRSAEYEELQNAIDAAGSDLEYAAPLTGENQQTVQMADLDGDGKSEYLLFARDTSEKPLRILIFSTAEEGYFLRETIESSGSAFELVEYANVDGKPGLELIVGRQVSDQLLRSLSVYSFSEGQSAQLMTTNYSKYISCNLDGNGTKELMVIIPGEEEAQQAVAVLYGYVNDQIVRSAEISLSETDENVRRIMTGNLQDGTAAVYVASSVGEGSVITDIFAMRDGKFANISMVPEAGTSIHTLRSYYIYADDVDNDGVLELPTLMTMEDWSQGTASSRYLIRWYSVDSDATETDKLFTFHDFTAGWYLRLGESWARKVSVVQERNSFVFSMWDDTQFKTEKIMTVYVLTGSEREKAAVEDGRFLLFRGDKVIYAARLEEKARDYGITRESLEGSFHLIHREWKTGEME